MKICLENKQDLNANKRDFNQFISWFFGPRTDFNQIADISIAQHVSTFKVVKLNQVLI